MAQASAGLPSQDEVAASLGALFARAGFEIDAVVVDARTRPPRLTVIADGDAPLTLDTVAELSRAASAQLDAMPGVPEDYVLEVSSPGVERPLTAPKHFARARGRRADLTLTDGSVLTGRIGAVTDRTLQLVVGRRGAPTLCPVDLDDVVSAVVQVEFTAPAPRELELAGIAVEGETP